MKTTVCLYRLIDSKTNALTLDHLKKVLSKNLVGKLVKPTTSQSFQLNLHKST